MKHVYLMPGLAASPKIFENLDLPANGYTVHHLEWLLPESKESIESYAARLTEFICHESPVLVGVSFGGILVQEIAKLIDVDKVIIISSVKSDVEFPRRMRVSRVMGIHKLAPTSLAGKVGFLKNYAPQGILRKRLELYDKYMNRSEPAYLDWALHTIVNWKQEKPVANIIHIHGDDDHIFPTRYIQDYIPVKGGSHIMIINRYKWFNENLPKIIDGSFQ